MAYNDFTLEMLKQQFGLRTDEQGDYFAQIAPGPISAWLQDHLHQYVPLALAISTEKARSELLIIGSTGTHRIIQIKDLDLEERFKSAVTLCYGSSRAAS